MQEWGIEISTGQLNRILVEDKEKYHQEKQNILRMGLKVSSYINTDDTSARHQGVHAERLINKIIPFTEVQRLAIENVQDEIWELYHDLKAYKKLTAPEQQLQKESFSTRFDQIFTKSTDFETLNQVLQRLWRRKSELLKVLEKPDLPLHNNASEQDIREFVTKRKISGSTRSNEGRRCRDTFASLKKTCRKLGVSFWNYLIDRVGSKNEIPTLAQLIAQKAGSLCPLAIENLGTMA